MANVKFQNALQQLPQACPPIWFMRQAGRYHKHYQLLRQRHSFMELCKNPQLAAEVALGPIADFDFDVAILFSDLLFPLEALGMGLTYDPAPRLGWSLTSERLKDLVDVERAAEMLLFQQEALRETRRLLPNTKSLIGFVGGPWTLFTYAVEGEHKGSLQQAKTQWSLFHQFQEHLMPLLAANIRQQLAGGAELVMVFDTAAGELSEMLFRQEVVPLLSTLAKTLPNKLGYYSKGVSAEHIQGLKDSKFWAGFGYDHRWSLSQQLLEKHTGFVQGNFDQALLFAQPRELEQLLDNYIASLLTLTKEQRAGWVCGLGHGVLPGTPEANVSRFVQRIREAF